VKIDGFKWIGVVHGEIIVNILPPVVGHSWISLWMHMGGNGLFSLNVGLGGMLSELRPCFLVM